MIKSFTTAFNPTSLWRLNAYNLVLMQNKTDSIKKEWVSDRLRDVVLLKVMDANNYSNPSQLKRAGISKDELLRKIFS